VRRTIGRRALFFGLMGLVCAVLIPVTPPELRWVDWFTAGLAAFWTILLALEDLSRPGPEPESDLTGGRALNEPQTPFGPPPRPGSSRPRPPP